MRLSEARIFSSAEEVQTFFLQALADGCEGLMAKSVGNDSIYRAGARGYLWIKYKKEYRSEMNDTVDLVAVGAFYGRGKRGGTYGALLMATYNPDNDMFETVCKLGSGFNDMDLATLPEKLNKTKIDARFTRVNSKLEADVWFEPALVLEVRGAEITLSPIHTCESGVVRDDAGFAIRFPRFTGTVRVDKDARGATTSSEIMEMYRKQLKQSN